MLKPLFFEAVQNGANVICISQVVIIFCAPNKTNAKRRALVYFFFIVCVLPAAAAADISWRLYCIYFCLCSHL